MAWIESHQAVSKHKKTLRAASVLKCDRHKLIGHLHELWWWAIDNLNPDGELGDLTDYEIAMAAEWDGDPEKFVAALTEAGYIDNDEECRYLHDWYDYGGKLVERRIKERQRSRDRRTTAQQPADDQTTTDGTVQYSTVDNSKKNIVSSGTPYDDIVSAYNSICKSLPKVKNVTEKRKRAMKTRWKKYNELSLYQQVFRKAEESDFLSGRDGKWTSCNFDWLLNENNMVKVLEGNYDNKHRGSPSKTPEMRRKYV